MKIYFIGQKGLPANFGGVEKHVEELSARLVNAGHEVYVYTRPNYTDANLDYFKGVRLISLPTIATKHLDTITHVFLACLDLRKKQVDLIHFHSIGPSFLIWLAKLMKPGVPIVATFHTKCYRHKKWGAFARFCLKLSERVTCLLADRLITVSKSLNYYVVKKYKINSIYIPNGANQEDYYEPVEIQNWGLKNGNYILSVSRLIKHKGIHYLINAYKLLNTDKKLVIVGDGVFTDDYVSELKEIAKPNPNIIFLGAQNGQILKQLYANAYLFIQPSESEGASIALLEAMSHERCVLISDIKENQEVIGDSGFMFINKNVADLKRQLEFLLLNNDLVSAAGRKAKIRTRECYNWDSIMESTAELYRMAAANKPGAGLLRKKARKLIDLFIIK